MPGFCRQLELQVRGYSICNNDPDRTDGKFRLLLADALSFHPCSSAPAGNPASAFITTHFMNQRGEGASSGHFYAVIRAPQAVSIRT